MTVTQSVKEYEMEKIIKRDEELSERANRVRMELYDWIQCVVTAVICGVLIFVFVGRTIGVDGRSMLQTLHHNDRVLISNLLYTPVNGDIIVFKAPSEQFEFPLVKRVIAVENQVVSIDFDTGTVYVDNIPEPNPPALTTSKDDFNGPLTIPPGFVFVLGDNRNSSTDSRSNAVGLVDTRYILGKVLLVLVPGPDESGNRDWNRFGFVS
jgi:signal peptidase I